MKKNNTSQNGRKMPVNNPEFYIAEFGLRICDCGFVIADFISYDTLSVYRV
jgi:hypothetical protein